MAILVNSETRSSRHAAVLAALQARAVDGLIVASLERDDPVLRKVVDDGMPVVTVNRRADGLEVTSVTHDEFQGMRLIVEHLHSLGHTRVVTIAGPLSISTGKARHEAFLTHAQALGLDTPAELVVLADAFNEKEGERCAALALQTLPGFTALVACNDRLAVGAIHQLRQQGITCPGGMSVTGFNDMPMVDRLEPPLTTVRVHQHELGRRAAEALLTRLARDANQPAPAPEHIVMPVELVVRGSTSRPSARRGKRRPASRTA
jgi:LacI family transcriptional regulator